MITGAIALAIASAVVGLAFKAGSGCLHAAREEAAVQHQLIAAWQPPDINAPLSNWFPAVAGPYHLLETAVDDTFWGLVGLHGQHPGARYRHADGHDLLLTVVQARTDAEREMVFSVLANHHERQTGNKSSVTTPWSQRFVHGVERVGVVAWRARECVVIVHGPADGEPETLLREWLRAAVETLRQPVPDDDTEGTNDADADVHRQI